MTTFLFKFNRSLDTVIEDGVYPFTLLSLCLGINRDPSTSDNRFDAPKALERAFRLSNDLSLNKNLNFVDRSMLIRVTFWYFPCGTLFSNFTVGFRGCTMVCPLGPMNPCIPSARGEDCCGCLGFCDAIGDDMASNLSRKPLPPWRKFMVDSSESLLPMISNKLSWNDFRMLDSKAIVTCGTGCVEPEERNCDAAISSESRINCLVSSASTLNAPLISASWSGSTKRRSAGGVLDKLLI